MTTTVPTVAVTLTEAVLAFAPGVPEMVAVPLPLLVNVSPCWAPVTYKVAAMTADGKLVVMAKVPLAPLVKLAVADEVKPSTFMVKTCVVSGPTPLLAWMVKE